MDQIILSLNCIVLESMVLIRWCDMGGNTLIFGLYMHTYTHKEGLILKIAIELLP